MDKKLKAAMSRDPLDDIEWPDWEEAGAIAEPVPAPPAEEKALPAEGEGIESQPAEDALVLAEEEAIEAQFAEYAVLLVEEEALDAQLAEDAALPAEEEGIEAQLVDDVAELTEEKEVEAQLVEGAALSAEEEGIETEPAEEPNLMAEGEAMGFHPTADLVDAPTEIEPAQATADGEIEAGSEAQEGRADTLSQLVATIDQEIEQALGSEAIAALVSAAPARESGEEQYAIFTLAGTEYAVPLGNVLEIGRPPNATPVPNVPDWVLGVANLRGDIISMVDLRAFLGMQRRSFGRDNRILVVQADQAVVTTGLVVDRINGIGYLAEDRIGPPHGPIEDQVTPYLHGVYEHDGRLLVVLDLDGLLLSPEMRQFEPM